MLILSLETSTNICSTAIHKDGRLLAYSEIQVEKSHAEQITCLAEQVLINSKVSLKDLDAIAVSAGPGSYTGLRIGSSTAKGFCYSLDKPLIAVNTLQSMASKFLIENYLVCPMLDARRMEVYYELFDHQNNSIDETRTMIVEDGAFQELLLNFRIIFCGNGSEKCKHLITSPNALFIENIYPNARDIGNIASHMALKLNFSSPSDFEPFYLKEFIALQPKRQTN